MLRIRLQRKGRKNSPFYRIVVAEHSAPIKGNFKEILGFLNPKTKESSVESARILHWISVGAQPSDHVARLCVQKGINECKKFIEQRKMKPSKVEQRAKEEAARVAEEKAKAAEAAKAAAAAEAAAKAEAEAAPTEEVVAEAPAEEAAEVIQETVPEVAPAEDAPAEAPAQEVAPEAPAEEVAEVVPEVPAEEEKPA